MMKKYRRFRIGFLSIILFISSFNSSLAQDGVNLVIFRDQDTFTLYVPPLEASQVLSLAGLRFEVGENGELAYQIASFPAFVGMNFEQLTPPLCFHIERFQTAAPLPMSCQGENVITLRQAVGDFDAFWYENQDLTVFIRGGLTEEICPSGEARCSFQFTASISEITVTEEFDQSLVTGNSGGGTVINISGGTVGAVINDSTIGELTVNVGDSPEEAARKARQRADVISAEVQQILQNVDSRLLLVDTTLDPSLFSTEIANVRETVVPGSTDVLSDAYDELMIRTQSTQLREAFSTTPLPSVANPALIALVNESSVNPFDIQFFYSQLNEINAASNNLLERLDALANAQDSRPEWLSYQQDSLALETQTLLNRSMLAYTTALRILGDLKTEYPDMFIPLDSFVYLEPRQLVGQAELDALASQHFDAALELVSVRAFLTAEGERLADDSLDDYALASDLLIIYPEDTWDVVVGKAVSLRQFGRETEALAAFARYGEMFAASDSTAEQYSRTAQQFTLQAPALGVAYGAAYVYGVSEDSPASRAGLQVGDIIVEFDGQDLTGTILLDGQETTIMDFLSHSFQNAAAGDEITVTYLRLNPDNTFSRQSTIISLNAEIFGLGVMPI